MYVMLKRELLHFLIYIWKAIDWLLSVGLLATLPCMSLKAGDRSYIFQEQIVKQFSQHPKKTQQSIYYRTSIPPSLFNLLKCVLNGE